MKQLSILAGIFVIVVSALIPSLLPIGIFWSISVAVLLSIICGVSGKFTMFKFSVGVVIGSVIWVGINFGSWGQLGVMLAVFQIAPTFASILAFCIAYIFSPVHENANT